MAKRAKEPESLPEKESESVPESRIVKVVDPFYDSAPEAEPPPQAPAVASGTTFGQRVRRFFEFLLRLVSLVIILGVISIGLYYFLPLIYQKFILPSQQNSAQLVQLETRQDQGQKALADLQARLEGIEAEQAQHAQSLAELNGRMSEIETEISARTKSLAALEEMQSTLQAQNEATNAELERQIDLLRAMELLSRARLFMYQSNFGLAKQDVQIARDLLTKVQPTAPEPLADDLNAVILRLNLTLSNLPSFPVAASDDLDIAWQILLTGNPPAQATASTTPVPEVTVTPLPPATVQPTATP